jgi:hypothetical protein
MDFLWLSAIDIFVFVFQTMTDVVGNPEEERRADYYYQPWSQEAVCRYFYGKVCFAVFFGWAEIRP